MPRWSVLRSTTYGTHDRSLPLYRMSATAVSVTRATTHLEHVVAGRASTARAGRVAAEVRQLLSPVSPVPCMCALLHTLLMRFIAIFAGIHWCNTRTAYEAQKSALMCSSKSPRLLTRPLRPSPPRGRQHARPRHAHRYAASRGGASSGAIFVASSVAFHFAPRANMGDRPTEAPDGLTDVGTDAG